MPPRLCRHQKSAHPRMPGGRYRFGALFGSIESRTVAVWKVRARPGECLLAVRWQGGCSGAHAIRRAVRARASSGIAAHQAGVARRGLGAPARQRLGVEDGHQRAADGPQRRCPPAAHHRNCFAAGLSVHCPRGCVTRRPVGCSKRFGTRSAQEPSFIGRAAALERLQQAWSTACSGKRVVIWVAGEPGIGKTTLIDRFVAGLGDVACARGQCVEHDSTGEPYLPVLEALGALCRSDSAVPGLLRAVAPTWLLQLPWLSSAEERDALRREVASVSPQRMLREMGEVLDRYTERRPLLLVTEDLHWSDPSTVRLIDYIARRHGAARLCGLEAFVPPRSSRSIIRSMHCGTSCGCTTCARRSRSIRSRRPRSQSTWRSARRRSPATKRSCMRCTSARTACRCSWRPS